MASFSLTVSEPAGVISADLGARAFAETALGKAAGMRLEGMRTHFHLEGCVIEEEAFNADIVFVGEHLSVVELGLRMAGDEKGWSGWSEAGERARKERGERWIQRVFAKPAEVLPIEFEGQQIVPFEKTWDAVRGIQFPWGKVTSFFDSKAGFAGILIRCGAATPD